MENKSLLVITALLGLSCVWNRPIPTQDIPASVLKAFRVEHPLAKKPQYRFEAVDGGMLFLVDFEEAGKEMKSEYLYDSKEWINDLGSEVVMTSLYDQDSDSSFRRDLHRTQF